MNRRLGSIALGTILLAGTVLAGCGGGKGGEGGAANGSDPAGGTKTDEKPVEITMMLQAVEPLPNDYFMQKEIEKKLNIKLNVQTYLPDDYKNKVNVGLAGGSAADIFFMDDRQMFMNYAKKGLLFDMTPHMQKLQSAAKFVGENRLPKGQVGGKQYGIPQTERAYQFSLWIRKDWLDALKLPVPKTTEELLATAKAFREKDPDGNGKNDTYGFTGRPNEALGPLFGAFGTAYPGEIYLKDGKPVGSIYDPAMKDALAFVKSMIDSGAVDPDFLANTKTQHKDKAFQGQVGIFFYNWPNIAKDEYVKQYQAVNPKAQWIQIEAPKGPGGQYVFHKDSGAASMITFPKTVEKDPRKVEKLIELLNYVSSPEGSKLVMYGLEGVHYTTQNGSIVVSTDPAKVAEAKYTYLFQITGRDEYVYLKSKFPNEEEEFTFADKQPMIQTYGSYIEKPEGYNPADAKRFYDEELYKFIYGKRPLSEYEAFVKTLEDTFKYKTYIEAAEKQLKEQGIVK